MNRLEARDFVKKIIKLEKSDRIKEVLTRYMSKFWTRKKKEDIVETAKKIFYEDTGK